MSEGKGPTYPLLVWGVCHMLIKYLTSAAQHEPLASIDNRGEPTYGPPATIYCRRQVKTHEIISPDKQIIKAEYVYYVKDAVVPGDKLDGRLVQMVEEWTLIGGQLMGYKVVV